MKPTAKIGILLAGAGSIVLCSYGVFLLTQPKQQAKIVLKRFLKACQTGDIEGVRRYSLIDELGAVYDDLTASQSTMEEDLLAGAEGAASRRHFQILSGVNMTDSLKETAALIRMNAEKERKYAAELAEKGYEVDTSGNAMIEDYLAYVDSAEAAYGFSVRYKENGEWFETDAADMVPVVKTGGVWRVDPVTPNILIPALRDPDEIENETEPES